MSVSIKNMDMPKDCVSCPMYDDSGDYPGCVLTGVSRGYNWKPFGQRMPDCKLTETTESHEEMGKESLTEYIKWLLSQVNDTEGDRIDKKEVRTMLLSIIGEMYSH